MRISDWSSDVCSSDLSLPGLSPRPGSWIEETGVFILSSRFEGFPNVLAEAMAAGLPVIAFDCAYGPGDLIIPGQNGILVPPEDVALLATAMTDLLSRRQLQAQLGSAAKRDARRFLPDAQSEERSGGPEGVVQSRYRW